MEKARHSGRCEAEGQGHRESGDSPEGVVRTATGLSRIGIEHGFSSGSVPRDPWRPRQVHGRRVVLVGSRGEPSEEADGAVSVAGGPAVAVVTADCVPLLLAAENGAAVAAVHVGWRGLAAGIVGRSVEAVRSAGSGLRLWAAIGPAASGCCYEVGPEVVEALGSGLRGISPGAGNRSMLDLGEAVEQQLAAQGLDSELIERTGPCTICSGGWPSYRREGAAAGRLTAWIAPANCP